jgi:hypothetical protein
MRDVRERAINAIAIAVREAPYDQEDGLATPRDSAMKALQALADAGLVIVSREDLVLGTTRGPSWDKDGIAQRYAAVNRLRAAIAPPVTEIES